jgi:1-acyl-sn-glycerol-3-phosphate acyltransferase
MAFGFARKLVYPLLRWRLASAEGLENLPKTGPAILVANHVGQQDPIMLIYLMARAINRKPRAITKWKIFSSKLALQWLQTIPLDPDRSKTIAAAEYALKHGDIILVYPEAGINIHQTIGKVKTGAARMALATRVPVIPLGLRRTSAPPTSEWKHILDIFIGRVHVRVGKPIDLSPWYGLTVDRPLLDKVTAEIMTRVAQLAGKTYTG